MSLLQSLDTNYSIKTTHDFTDMLFYSRANKEQLYGMFPNGCPAFMLNKKMTDQEVIIMSQSIWLSGIVTALVDDHALQRLLARLCMHAYRNGNRTLYERTLPDDSDKKRKLDPRSLMIEIQSDCDIYCIMVNRQPFAVFEVNSNLEMLVIYVDNKMLYLNYDRLSDTMLSELVQN